MWPLLMTLMRSNKGEVFSPAGGSCNNVAVHTVTSTHSAACWCWYKQMCQHSLLALQDGDIAYNVNGVVMLQDLFNLFNQSMESSQVIVQMTLKCKCC